MANQGVVTLHGRFQDGTKVSIYPRDTDYFPGVDQVQKAVKTGTPKDGELKLDGLEVDGNYWVVQTVDGETRHAAITAHDPALDVKPKRTKPDYRGVLPGGYATVSVEGARSASAIPKAHGPSKHPTESPHHDVADVKGAKRSDTPMGAGHPVDKDEEGNLPNQPQSAVDDKTPQRSSTPLGEATPIPKDELEDAGKDEARSKAAKKAAATRRRKAKARSEAAKKAADTRRRQARARHAKASLVKKSSKPLFGKGKK